MADFERAGRKDREMTVPPTVHKLINLIIMTIFLPSSFEMASLWILYVQLLTLLIEGKIRASTSEACHFEVSLVSEDSLPFVFSCTSYQKSQIANSWWEWHFVFLPTPCLFSVFIIIWILDNMRHCVKVS